ncbi:enoyl-CoA hydratase [Alloalcanivorax xenomutans]|uniref:Enoyl-CoA hydratase domain-containing protein 3, mitochondrial n=1 Tax=Alloalcanivorax xenomutans TaxID=1094342 RepID=A0A9Q3ZDH2_9GAMM|nr:enoyl-CoA hydratase [Alloalcanivorax xenomutans]ARB44572.1 enoyl-CoA hydratase [Alloalcanivorax xenomutans]MCE7509490.1 enoyl-CoA hydratase [Alloalcanivorax xenomutans]
MSAQADLNAPLILREDQDGLVTLTLNRPRHYNALSEEMLAALKTELDALATDETLRCVVLRAAGKAFCAGHDLRQMYSHLGEEDYYRQLFATCSGVMQSLLAVPVPVIAVIQGVATAAGCQLVASCDLAVATDSARFAVSGINAGLFCSTPSVALSRNVSAKRAFEMLVTARFIDAATAADWGLINQAVPEAELGGAVTALATSIMEKSPAAIRHGKAMFYRQRQLPLDEAYRFAGEVMARNMMEADAAEGIDAFLNKRAAQWQR